MHIRHKMKLRVLLITALFFTAVIVILQFSAKNSVENFLERKIPKHLQLKYEGLDVNLLWGNIGFEQVSLKFKNRDSLQTHTFFQTEGIQITGLKYWQFIFNNTIAVEDMVFQSPKLNYYPFKYIASQKAESKGVVNLLKDIEINRLHIDDGSFYIMKDAVDSIQVAISSYNFTLSKGRTDTELISEKIPITYDSYELEANDIFADLGKYETLNVAQVLTTETEFEVTDIHLESKYDKNELSKNLFEERDYIKLEIPKIILGALDFGFTENRFGIGIDSIKIKEPEMEIYRDKVVPDDLKPKKMYSDVLRELPLNLSVTNISITDGYLAYGEKQDKRLEEGVLIFDQLQASVKNLSNHKDVVKTSVSLETNVMGQAPLILEWSFDVNSPSDEFIASGSLKDLQAKHFNTFLEPNLRVRAKGDVQELYFTFEGNARRSHGNMKMKYNDFKFDILDKDRLKINRFLTTVGNLFINDGSKNDAKGFRYGTMEVEREVNKSFFNYLWSNVRDGIVSTLTGNGEKETKK